MISTRIQTIASLLPPAKSIADVGCDHGYLLIEGFEKYGVERAVAIDNKAKPLQNAVLNLKNYPWFSKVRFSLSNGLEDLSEEVDAIILSGMGGLLMIDILKQNLDKIKNSTLIIQANRNQYDVRIYLVNLGYQITSEELVFEDKGYYVIDKFALSTNNTYSNKDLYFGPILRSKRSPLFLQKLHDDLQRFEKIPFHTEEIQRKIRLIREEIENEN